MNKRAGGKVATAEKVSAAAFNFCTMEILLKRVYKKPDYTIGKIYIDGVYLCDSCEDCDRGLLQSMSLQELQQRKKYGITAIPRGRYEIKLTQSARFKRVLPILLNVPAYEGVRIHAGNYPKDSLGCILPGENKVKGGVINSKKYEDKICDYILQARDKKQSVFITIE